MCSIEAYAASQVLQAGMQYKADSAKAKNINANSQATAANMRNSAIWDDNALIRKKEDKRKELATEKLVGNIQGKQKQSKVKLSLAEKGIGGNAVDLLIGDTERQLGFWNNTLDNNYESYIRGINTNREATNLKYTNAILSLPRAAKPSWGMYALQAGINVGSMYMMTKAPNVNANGAGAFDGASSMSLYVNDPTSFSGSR